MSQRAPVPWMLKSLNKLFLRRENVQNTQGSYNQVNAKEKYLTAIILMLPIWKLTCGFLSGFSLTVWKQENEVNGTTLTTAEIVVLQEDLGLSRYFLDSACSRSTALYNPHIDYWRNGNYRAKLICVLCYRFSLNCWMVLRR